jgi:dTDP-4-dehydrorhamnose 3,5-epimerase
MIFTECSVAGAWMIDPTPHVDGRGRFMRAWCMREFAQHGLDFHPVQVNMGFSTLRGTVRGMHVQTHPAEEAKLVRCTRGRVFDVLVDLRPSSPTYGNWYGTELSADDGRMLYVPEQCAHGYQTLEDSSEVLYQTSAFYAPETVRGLRFDDPSVGIAWPLPASDVSEQDRRWPFLKLGSR